MTPHDIMKLDWVRRVEFSQETYFSAVDCCEALGYEVPEMFWESLKIKHPQLTEVTISGKIINENGKRQDSDMLELTGMIELFFCAPMGNTKEFQTWLCIEMESAFKLGGIIR